MYDKTSAVESRIYSVTLTATPTTIYDLLSAGDKAEYDEIVNTGIASIRSEFRAGSNAKTKRSVVDGYVIGDADVNVSSSNPGAKEVSPAGEKHFNPIHFWTEKVLFDGSGTAIVRIFFS